MAKLTRIETVDLLKDFFEAATGRKISSHFIFWYIKNKFPEIKDPESDIWNLMLTDKNYGKE